MINFDPLTKERQNLLFLLQYRTKAQHKKYIPDYHNIGYFRISKYFKKELKNAVTFFKDELAKGEKFLFPMYTIQVPSVNLIKLEHLTFMEEINLSEDRPVMLTNLGEGLDNISEGVSARVNCQMGKDFSYVSGFLKDLPMVHFRSVMFPTDILVENPFPNPNKNFIYW